MGDLFLFYILIFVFMPSNKSDRTTPNETLEEHVKKIDELLSEMQSHAQAQEQKYSAVLSSLLSQLTQTTDELEDLKASHNKTISILEEKDSELSQLWENHTATERVLLELKENHTATIEELHNIRSKHNNVVIDLENTMAKLDDFEKRPIPIDNIGFFGKLKESKNTTINEPIIFDNVVYDSESAYSTTTGKFLVPRNGTYQIWIDLSYLTTGYDITFFILTENYEIDRAYGGSSDHHESASTITMGNLQQGQSVWLRTKANVFLYSTFCNFGIVLINAN